MNVAHGVGGGINLEALLVAVPLVGLGVLFFFQKSASPMVSLVMILVGLAIGAAGLTILRHDEPEAATAKGNSYGATFLALCEAQEQASTGPDEAERIFFDRVHSPLHELAAKVGEEDREVAARLLEAKNQVESALEDPEGSDLTRDFDLLVTATARSLTTLDMQVAACS